MKQSKLGSKIEAALSGKTVYVDKMSFVVPNDQQGRLFVSLCRLYLNKDFYHIRVRFRGPRTRSKYNTLKKDATSFAIYIFENSKL
ncbi:MAG: hypothetical protein WC554_13705 [Clostridia bacterium]|jgi:hypothetical protein